MKGKDEAPRSRRGLWIGIAAAALLAIVGIGYFAKRGGELAAVKAGTDAVAATSPTAAPERSIAVLPFVNMSSDPEQEYFSDGISEELLNLLTKIPQLRVTSRSSAFSFKGEKVEIPEIARRLNVAHILEGSVRKSGNQVRITAQLIEARSDTHLWSETYDRTLDDLFAIQDEIAADVVRQLKVTLLGAAPKSRETNPKAYALYLQAVEMGRQTTAEGYEHSDALLQQVLTMDPNYPPAWSELAWNYFYESNVLTLRPTDEGSRLARTTAERALELDPDYAPAHAQLGTFARLAGDLAGAAKHLERALALEPANPSVLSESARLLWALGRLEESIALMEHVVDLDPVNVRSHYNLGLAYSRAGRSDEASAAFRKALSLSPGRGGAQFGLGVALLLGGEPEAALEAFEKETSESWRRCGLPMAYHALGRKADSDAALAESIEKDEKDSAYNIAYVFAFRGEADRAFEWLEKAAAYHDGGLSQIVVEPLFANIQNDSRWLPFLRKIGKAPEQLAKIEFKVTLPE